MSGRLLIALLCSLLVLSATVAGSAEPPHYRGIFSFQLENDYFARSDNNYTNGIALTFTSAEVSSYGKKNFFRKMTRAFSFLPKVGDAGYSGFVAFALGQEMYTPNDITLPEPPPGDQPYAGVLFLDTTLSAKGVRSLHSYGPRIGVVGPAAGAAQLQKWLHEIVGSPTPEGWHTQLRNEPLLNLQYQYHRRLVRRAKADRFGYDVTVNGGGGAGNYYTGANAGAILRFGLSLPDTYGAFHLRRGGEALVGLAPPPERWMFYAAGQVNGFGVARFLPTDGNTFVDSREGNRDDFVAFVTGGLVLGYRRLVLTYMYNAVISRNNRPGSGREDFATLSVSYIF